MIRKLLVAAPLLMILGCAAPTGDEPTGETSDAINYADLRVRTYGFELTLAGSRACTTTPDCRFRVRATLRNVLGGMLHESCSVVFPGEASPFGSHGIFMTNRAVPRPGFPGFADAGSVQLTLEEGTFATRREPNSRSFFSDSCAPAPGARQLLTSTVSYDHDRQATGHGDIIQVTYFTDATFDVNSGAIVLARGR